MSGGRTRILLVDDSKESYLLIRTILSLARGAFDLEWVQTYQGALREIGLENHDVWLLDYRLDEYDGVQVLREAFKSGCKVPMILLTSEGDREIALAALDAGAADYLDKGHLDASLLERAIRYAIERKRAESALRRSEEQYRLLFESNPQPMWVFDLETLRFLAVNGAAVRHYGYSREEFLAMTLADIRPPEDVPALYARMAARQPGLGFSGQWGHITKDGELIDVETTGHSIAFEGREAVFVLATDVTERKRAEEALRESETRLRRLVDANILGIFFSDFSGAITEANDAFLQMIGYTRGELLAGELNWRTLTPPEYWPLADRVNEELRMRGVYEPVEKEYIRSDGTRIPVLVGGALFEGARDTGLGLEFVLDLTERKQAEDAVRREKEHTAHIISAAPVLICGIAPDGTTTFANRAVERVTGYSSHELVGENWWKTFYPGDEQRQVEQLSRDLESGQVMNYEMALTTKRGEKRTISWNSVNRVDDANQPVELVGIGVDITERNRLEEHIRQSQKIEAVGQLAGGIAHDFNNLLTVISGYSEFMLKSLRPEDPLWLDADEIRKAADHATSLTRQLLAFSRRQILQPKILNLNEVVADMDKLLRRLIGEEIDLLTNLAPKVGFVKTDPGQLEQVVVNLAVNARDAMPKGGKLTIGTADVDLAEADASRPSAVPPGRYVTLVVSDTGAGMDQQTLERIFEPFFTTKEVGKGTGLGLATVYGIIKQSSGSVLVDSEVGHGTTFKIFLPRVEPQAARSPDKKRVDREALGGVETVLVVEDEDGVRALTRESLLRRGYRVLDARDSLEALQLCEETEGPIHLLVTDVVMPKMNGRELAEHVAVLRPGIRVLFMSGYTQDAIIHRGVLNEETEFLEKPFTPDGLARKVRKILDGVRE
jgi:two-component system cell cycle sensor histidine kinase/response regulator CckA